MAYFFDPFERQKMLFKRYFKNPVYHILTQVMWTGLRDFPDRFNEAVREIS